MKNFYYGCPNCSEPKTELDQGKHIFIKTTATNYGNKCKVLVHCVTCGFIKDITEEVVQITYSRFDELINK